MLLRTKTYVNNILTTTVEDTARTLIMGYIWSSINTNRTTIETWFNDIFTYHNTYGYSSCKYLRPMLYQYAIIYVGLIQLDYNKYGETDWDYYNEKFSIETMNERFNCNSISLNSIFNSFNLPINVFNI